MGPRGAPKTVRVRYRPVGAGVFIRFVCFQLVDGQRSRLGLFQAFDEARESDHAPGWAIDLLEDTNDWFANNLLAPPIFDEREPREHEPRRLCWFRSTATEHIARMYDVKTALEACGVHVEVLRTRTPGRIDYEDEHQVAAVPIGRRF